MYVPGIWVSDLEITEADNEWLNDDYDERPNYRRKTGEELGLAEENIDRNPQYINNIIVRNIYSFLQATAVSTVSLSWVVGSV
jgi:hypothetical protein